MILSVDGVEFSYGSRSVLKNVMLEVKPGEVLAILGNNGAGKSTLLKCLNKILKPQRGTVLIEGEDLYSMDRCEIARRAGYVAQKQDGMRCTVFDAVLLGRRPYFSLRATQRDLKVVENVLRLLGLEEYSFRYIDELSGGELQKVVIARALAQEPRVLLLDEPTSSLDLKNQYEVLQIIKDAVKEQNIAAVVVMHDLNLALRFSDKFLLMKNGRVFAFGGMEIITSENIAGVYGIRVALENIAGIPVVVPL
ncbi:MAG: iron complex transport system ATP-binding protein [Tepidanaerobacteraceae bacterium]|nr:iron complex transport system ATP-binding protein [Tepidanaerobacteraceae bacterium]